MRTNIEAAPEGPGATRWTMYEEPKADLIDALEANNAPLPWADAVDAIDKGDLISESTINHVGTTEEVDGTRYVVGVDNGPQFDVDDIDPVVDEEPAESPAESPEPEPDPAPAEEDEGREEPTAGRSWDADDDRDVYEVNGLKITVDPERELVGEPTGDDWFGLPVLSNGHDRVPNETTPYFPVEVGGNRDSEEVIGRTLGVRNRPLLLEGEAGTGKNRGIDRAASATNRITQRIGFGADISVFDFVGEKDIVDGESVYILGSGAKAAMFGHLAIFDEVNMATGDVTSFLHAITEEVGSRQFELRGTEITLTDLPVSEEEIDEHGSWYEAARAKWDPDEHLGEYIHPEFKITATCNPLDYADTKSMNDAFRDRFVVMPHPYLEKDQEKALLAEETGADAQDLDKLVRLANTLREAKQEANAISCPITHRSLLKTVEMAGPGEDFMSFREAAQIVIVNHASTKQDKQFIQDAIADEL